MKAKTKKLLAAGILILAVAAMAGIYLWTRPQPAAGEKSITVEVSYADTQKVFPVVTEEEYLGPALLEAGIAEGETGQFGLFITTVDGVTAKDSEKQWWQLTRDGELLETGADATPIADGEKYELTLSTY